MLDHFGHRVATFLDYCLGKKNWSVRWDTDKYVVTMTVDTGGRLTDDIIPDLEQIAYDTLPSMYLARWIIT